MRPDTVIGYTFQADEFCPECIGYMLPDASRVVDLGKYRSNGDTEAMLSRIASERGVDRFDESTFDSGEFPKVIFADQLESSTGPCGMCQRSITGWRRG